MSNIQLKVDKNLYLELLKKVLTASMYDNSSWCVIYMDVVNWRKEKNLLKRVRNHIKYNIIEWLNKRSYLLVKRIPLDIKAREIGNDWPNLMGFTMVGHRRLDNVQACIEDVLNNNIEGDFIETGAWRGGVTIFMRAMLKYKEVSDRVVWVADSFEGLPPPEFNGDGSDLSSVQMLKVSIEQVKDNFEKFGLLDGQVKFLKGWFSDTLPEAPINKLAILRLDGDMYNSTMDALKNLYPKVSKGGYVIVDDYYSWESCRKAVTDYLEMNSLNPKIMAIDQDAAYWKCE
jgi:O-methyltransferase